MDKLPQNSLKFAKIQNKLGIKGSYYFRIVPESFDPAIITKIAELGHEIGYHYEDIDLVYQKNRKKNIAGRFADLSRTVSDDLLDEAIESFEKNLTELRKYYDVKTICMHGSPLSPFDNKALWSKYDYHDFGIIGEPYFDVDFNEVAYYTDTGRRWDGEDFSVRDKVETMNNGQLIMKNETSHRATEAPSSQHLNPSTSKPSFPKYHSTQDIIDAINAGTFPSKAMLTFHPQRWTDNPIDWTKELILQNAKNVVKKYFIKGHR